MISPKSSGLFGWLNLGKVGDFGEITDGRGAVISEKSPTED